MRSLQFNRGVYSIHTVTFIVNRPWFLFYFMDMVVIHDALQKVMGKSSASKISGHTQEDQLQTQKTPT